MSNAAVAMPFGVSCAGIPGMPMTAMPHCQGALDMGPHAGAMSGQCISICAEGHAPGGLRLPEMAFPAPAMAGFVTFSHPAMQNWFLKYELQGITGVAEVATVGGMYRSTRWWTRRNSSPTT